VEFIFILSNFVRSYINPLALLGIVAALAIGIILGVSVAQKRSRSKEERMEKWSEVRVRGRTRFLIQYGLLFGVLMTVFNTLLREIFDTTRSSKMFWIIALVNLIKWGIYLRPQV
jgi:membrane protein CcdC involved in cytochrome C biogenesis